MKNMMKQSNSHPGRWLVAACTLLMILSVAPAGFAQQANQTPAQPKQPAASAPSTSAATSSLTAKPSGEEKETAAPGKPGNEGIKIHGHWVLDVKNPDGKVVEHREFNNSLVTDDTMLSGDQVLAGLLSGNVTPGDPSVAFIQPPLPANISTYCSYLLSGGAGQYAANKNTCYGLTTSQTNITFDPNFVIGLTTTAYFSPSAKWVLSGNYTVPSGLTTISVVQTLLTLCVNQTAPFLNLGGSGGSQNNLQGASTTRAANLAPNACIIGPVGLTLGSPENSGEIAALTSTVITSGGNPAPLTVTLGQVITVTVTLSFS